MEISPTIGVGVSDLQSAARAEVRRIVKAAGDDEKAHVSNLREGRSRVASSAGRKARLNDRRTEIFLTISCDLGWFSTTKVVVLLLWW